MMPCGGSISFKCVVVTVVNRLGSVFVLAASSLILAGCSTPAPVHHANPFYLAPADSVRAPDASPTGTAPSHTHRPMGGVAGGGFGGGM